MSANDPKPDIGQTPERFELSTFAGPIRQIQLHRISPEREPSKFRPVLRWIVAH